jgi:predicted amidophosphoribosyltransferase
MKERKYQKRNNVLCSGCGNPIENDRDTQRYCRKCHAENMKEQRRKNAEELKMLREFYKLHNA